MPEHRPLSRGRQSLACLPCSHGPASAANSGRGAHPPARPDRSWWRGDLPRFGRRRLDLSLARPDGARLSRLGPARESRPARSSLRRGRALLRRAVRRGGRRRQRRAHRGRLAQDPLLVRCRPSARHRSHGLRPGRDRPLPARSERRREGDQAAARGRSRTPAAHGLAGGDGGVLPRRRPRGPDRRVQQRHEAGPHPRGDPPAPTRAASGRRAESAAPRGSSEPSPLDELLAATAGSSRLDLGAGLTAVREYDHIWLENTPVTLDGEVRWGEWRIASKLPGLKVRAWRAGDRLAGRSKKIQDVFVDAKIPRSARESWPLVVRGDDVVAVPGIVEAEGVLVERVAD